jgi:hypothetical protein
MLAPLFSAFEVARKRLNRMLNAARIRVCPVVDTEVEECLLVAILLRPQAGSGRKTISV